MPSEDIQWIGWMGKPLSREDLLELAKKKNWKKKWTLKDVISGTIRAKMIQTEGAAILSPSQVEEQVRLAMAEHRKKQRARKKKPIKPVSS
jgi:hypothetical protein